MSTVPMMIAGREGSMRQLVSRVRWPGARRAKHAVIATGLLEVQRNRMERVTAACTESLFQARDDHLGLLACLVDDDAPTTTYASPRGIDIGGEDPASRARPNARTQSAITEVLPRLVGRSTWYGQSLFANFRKGATAIGTGAGRCPSCHHRSARSSVRRRDVPPALRASNRRLTSLLFPAPVKADNTHPPKIIRPRL